MREALPVSEAGPDKTVARGFPCQERYPAYSMRLVQAESLAQLPTFYAEDTPASANELWSRLHSDPLFAVRPAGRLILSLGCAYCRPSRPSIMHSA